MCCMSFYIPVSINESLRHCEIIIDLPEVFGYFSFTFGSYDNWCISHQEEFVEYVIKHYNSPATLYQVYSKIFHLSPL